MRRLVYELTLVETLQYIIQSIIDGQPVLSGTILVTAHDVMKTAQHRLVEQYLLLWMDLLKLEQ